MKTPKQLRSDIQTLTTHLSQVQESLLNRSTIKVAHIGKECKRTADALGLLLKSQQVPSEYKVAVVGRFKAGKSSFVNELLGTKLASEGTLPETAAVTTFRYGSHIQACIRFVDHAKWSQIKTLYAEDAKNTDAHRAKNWDDFSQPKKTKDDKPAKVFDLTALERQYVRDGGHTHTLELPANSTQKASNEFRRMLKEFTSATSPLHCLVDKIDITAPAEILDQGVLLIDTPGLDDTERFRVNLTEKVVADVDAVLFLTKSGASYGQSEKDFLLTLLRKGTVKQLIVVITQIDETYTKVLAEAEDNDEDPDSIADCIAKEESRITEAIAATLKDLSQDESLLSYQEQLGEVPIAFTSARLHRDWKGEKALSFGINDTDPGGVETLKVQLLKLLSTESRLAQTTENIVNGARNSLLDLQSVLQAKLHALRNTQNKEVAEQKLNTFRKQFGQASVGFEGAIEQQIKVFSDRLMQQNQRDTTILELIGVLAEQPLADLERDDVGQHWKTRRYGGWGYMRGLQGNVANQIFPKVRQLLGERTQLFSKFAEYFESALTTLSHDSDRIAQQIELGASVPLDVTGKLKISLNRSLQRAQEVIDIEETKVLQLLEDFVTDEVSERISERRKVVENIWDVGTTVRQNAEVIAFYREVKKLLKEALRTYLKDSSLRFGEFLLAEAKAAPRDALNEVHLLLEQAADNILAVTAEHLTEMKESAESVIGAIEAELTQTLQMTRNLMPHGSNFAFGDQMQISALPAAAIQPANKEQDTTSGIATSNRGACIDSEADTQDWRTKVQRDATVAVGRIHLNDGAAGWPYEKLFEPRVLQGVVRLVLVDPYLAKPHQLRNLQEFLLHIAEIAHPKEIEVVTSFSLDDSVHHQDHVIQEATNDIFKNYGVVLTLRREAGLHDRYLMLDHGVLFTLGRGLDIYKPATGLAAHRPANRRVRATRIDIFAVPGHALITSTKS
ncbi:MAG: hypothetical protein A3J24_06730 [Deltaproteobacteria bacterium RIFCSPLOWO2_02_FULL_53_8]|nr:MAG: hypothetical protein A3J24_06730 [Deltaproteobacteria bacterium RIFCSPLOWO2_02_FULL_53_8]